MITLLPLKISRPIDLVAILSDYITKNYSIDVANNHSDQIEFIHQTRSKALAAIQTPSQSIEV